MSAQPAGSADPNSQISDEPSPSSPQVDGGAIRDASPTTRSRDSPGESAVDAVGDKNKDNRNRGDGAKEDGDGAKEDGDDEEDDDDEPVFKYARLGSHSLSLLAEDTATCLTVQDKFLILGTASGRVHLLDFTGSVVRTYTHHSFPITSIKLDASGDYIASSSTEGLVVVLGLYNDDKMEYLHNRPVSSIAVDPLFSKKSNRRIVTGGKSGVLTMHTKGGWFSSTKDVVISQNEGEIFAVQWFSNFLAWATPQGVKVIDTTSMNAVVMVRRPESSPRPDMSRCTIYFTDVSEMVVGWSNFVKVVGLRAQSPSEYQSQIVSSFELGAEELICGCAQFLSDLVLLIYNTATNILQFRVVNRQNGETLSSDELTLSSKNPLDYSLSNHRFDDAYYIVAPHDIVVAKPRDVDDHVHWLIEHSRFEAAFSEARLQQRNLKTTSVRAVGELLLEELIHNREFSKCCDYIVSIASVDPSVWVLWMQKFLELDKIELLQEKIPVTGPAIPMLVREDLYTQTLVHLLEKREVADLIGTGGWDMNLYVVDKVTEAARKFNRLESLAQIFMLRNDHHEAFLLLLQQQSARIFAFLERHEMWADLLEHVLEVVAVDRDRAINLLKLHTGPKECPVADVVDVFSNAGRDDLLFLYLDATTKIDLILTRDYHDRLLVLYTTYSPSSLLELLGASDAYQLDAALELFSTRGLLAEKAFVLGRMGQSREALHVLMVDIGSVKDSISFVQSLPTADQEELWADLVQYALSKGGEAVGELLECNAVDLRKLIERIPTGLEIPKLRDRLVKVMNDSALQLSLQETCRSLLQSDCVALMRRLVRARMSARRLNSATDQCALCRERMEKGSVVVFMCGHTYHAPCLRRQISGGATASAGASGGVASPSTAAADRPGAAAGGSGGGADEGSQGMYCVFCRSASRQAGHHLHHQHQHQHQPPQPQRPSSQQVLLQPRQQISQVPLLPAASGADASQKRASSMSSVRSKA